MTKKSSIFKKILEDKMESDIPAPQDLEKTIIGDFPSPSIDIIKPDINKIPVGELTEDQKDILKLRQIMGDTRIRAKLAEGGLSSYAKPISKNLQKAKDLIKKIKGIGSVAKFAGPVVAGISAAAEVLATPNVGEGETSEVNRQLKEEEMRRSMSPDQRQALQRIKDKSEEIAKKPVSPIDMIKEVGGAADINPKQAQLMQGEQDSPDIEDESSLNIENYEKLLKRKLGYK